jgi:hypothetical protein
VVCFLIAEQNSEAFKLEETWQNFLAGNYQVRVGSLSADETWNLYCLNHFFLNVTLLSECVCLLEFSLKNIPNQPKDKFVSNCEASIKSWVFLFLCNYLKVELQLAILFENWLTLENLIFQENLSLLKLLKLGICERLSQHTQHINILAVEHRALNSHVLR